MLKPIVGGYGMPNFTEKSFTGSSKTAKFVNVFFFRYIVSYLHTFTYTHTRHTKDYIEATFIILCGLLQRIGGEILNLLMHICG